MTGKLTAGLLAATFAVFGQGARPAFEVASIKVAEPIASRMSAGGQLRIGTVIEGNRVEVVFASLADIIRQAYRLKSYQFQGPDWMSSDRYDIRAKMPDGVNKEQVPEMLQSLLEERFKFTFHRGSKEHAIFALVPGKNGIKLKEVEPDPPADSGGTAGRTVSSSSGSASAPILSPFAGGTPSAEAERAMVTTRSVQGSTTAMMGGPGMHLDRKMTMAQFAEVLGRFVDRPVVDMTESKATYQVALDIPIEEILKMAHAGSGNIMVISSSGGMMPHSAGDSAADPTDDSVIFAKVQEMGLKLEKRKSQVEILVAEGAEKRPVE